MVKRVLACLITLTLVFTSVNLYEAQASKKLKLNKTKTFVRIGSPVKLKVKNAKKKKIKWKSSNKKIATVSKKGVVKGKKYGKCYVTAKIGKKKLKCRVIVTHKVAKVITKKTMRKLANILKKHGTYLSDKNLYRYIRRDIVNDYVYVCEIIYYVKTNHLGLKYSGEEMNCEVEFHVGDKQYCHFDGVSNANNVYMKGSFDKRRMSDRGDAVNIIDTDVPEYYHENAKEYVFNYIDILTYMFDDAMKKINADVYCEDLGFNIPLSYFK